MTLLTEDEAKTKWCPLARAPGGMFVSDDGQDKRIGVTQNRGYQMGGALSNCMCIGSACMAWRWGSEPNPHHSNYLATTEPSTIRSERGYCGAFGKVEQ